MCDHMEHRKMTTCAIAILLAACNPVLGLRDPHHDEDMMPGWMGSDFKPPAAQPDTLAHRTERMQVLDADARIFLFKGFLTPEECDYIIKLAEPRLSRSGVVANEKTGSTEINEIRTSYGVFLERGEDDVVKGIEERIAAWTLMPVKNQEGLQVLRYVNGQKYDAHWDYFFHKEGTANGGNRYATVLTYLSDVEEGGETVFPYIPAPGGENKGFSECARHHLAVKPRKGDAVLFHSIAPNGALEKKSMHTACPVIKGTKWSMPKWIHVGPYAVGGEEPVAVEQSIQPLARQPGGCEDLSEFCESWAMSGECEKNPGYMIGSKVRPGSCLNACKRCDILKEAHEQQPEAVASEGAVSKDKVASSRKMAL